ncbi:MAG: arylamine N-acetyltransferase [Ardenticatenaceae bacterium]|nr:arylamine N-acetyltransferase [Ardenticatenaceae bacterium]MCB9446216.1 arylamine N-acetyltransferase [Ardenticatenaceae bacterium]
MSFPRLSPALVKTILRRFDVVATLPTLSLLETLVNAYIRTVPWETVFRIVKRARTAETAVCPRWPEEFWTDNLERGGGGTCFESNYAFFSLLQALGYEGYLTINNMGDSIGCHTAIIILINGQKWLVDAGFPLYAPLPVSPYGTMHRTTQFMKYTVRPDGPDVYQIEQHPHPNRNAFTLIDRPVPDETYLAATTTDYGPDGLFLDRIVINKVVADQTWRFNTGEQPWQLLRFVNGMRTGFMLDGDAATAVAQHFAIDKSVVQAAFQALSL